jgi:hypothetical protein
MGMNIELRAAATAAYSLSAAGSGPRPHAERGLDNALSGVSPAVSR